MSFRLSQTANRQKPRSRVGTGVTGDPRDGFESENHPRNQKSSVKSLFLLRLRNPLITLGSERPNEHATMMEMASAICENNDGGGRVSE